MHLFELKLRRLLVTTFDRVDEGRGLTRVRARGRVADGERDRRDSLREARGGACGGATRGFPGGGFVARGRVSRGKLSRDDDRKGGDQRDKHDEPPWRCEEPRRPLGQPHSLPPEGPMLGVPS